MKHSYASLFASLAVSAAVSGPASAFTLELLHAADQEAGAAAVDDAPRFSAVLNALKAEDIGNDGLADNTLVLSSGDAIIPGLFYDASGPVYGRGGVADIQIQNELGFQAIALGNHEFDFGPGTIADLISGAASTAPVPTSGAPFGGTNFPYLSSNLDFSTEPTLAPLEVPGGGAPLANSVSSSTVIDVNGEPVGVVGATTPTLDVISSPGGVGIAPADFGGMPGPAELDALAAEIQAEVDALLAAKPSINKVVVLAHMQQIAIEQELATRLSQVDVIVGGGSNTRLFDANDRPRPGDSIQGEYPIFEADADGRPVAIVNTDGSYKYVGRLVIDFDASGNIIPASYDPVVSGAYATDDQGVADLGAAGLVDPEIQQIADEIRQQIITTDGNFFGVTDVFLNGNRGGSDVDGVRTQETNLGNLSADANLHVARMSDPTVAVSIKNGGGIRASIGETVVPPGGTEAVRIPPQANPLSGRPEGGISQNAIQTTLAFNNNLTLLTLTHEELVAVLEHGVAATDGDPDNAQGRFPQVSGVRFAYDPAAPAGSKIVSASFFDEASGASTGVLVENGAVVEPSGTVRIVTLGFLAGGGDGYPFPATDRVDLDAAGTSTGDATFAPDGTEQDALAEYLDDVHPDVASAFGSAELPITQDPRIQSLLYRSDTVNFPPVPAAVKALTKIGNFDTGIFDESAAEIVAFDADSQRIFFINADAATVTVLDAADPANLTEWGEINVGADFNRSYSNGYSVEVNPNSVAVHDGLVAVALHREITRPNGRTSTARGIVAFYDTDGQLIDTAWAGYLPDSLAFSPDGKYVVVANEGEPSDDYKSDPIGSVTTIEIREWRGELRFKTRRDSFGRFGTKKLRNAGVRIFGPKANAAKDMEPEFVCVSPDSKRAYVTVQENNAIAEVDLRTGKIRAVTGLGSIDYMSESQLDPSDRDDTINIGHWPIQGLFMPDAIACYEVAGTTYLVTANEGDARDYDAFAEEERIKDLVLDPAAFPNADLLQQDEALGRLNVTLTEGDTDGDGDYDELYAFGTRSFTIWKVDHRGKVSRVWDSGADFEKITASLLPAEFNANNDENGSFESRSDNKGPEPEGIALGEVDGRVCAFIGLERIGGVMVYDITDPAAPAFVQYVNARDFTGDAEAGTAGDLGPEGLVFISAADSPTGKPLLVVSNEVSGNVSVFEID